MWAAVQSSPHRMAACLAGSSSLVTGRITRGLTSMDAAPPLHRFATHASPACEAIPSLLHPPFHSFTCSFAHSVTHSIFQAFACICVRSLTRSLTQSRTRSITHSLTHSHLSLYHLVKYSCTCLTIDSILEGHMHWSWQFSAACQQQPAYC